MHLYINDKITDIKIEVAENFFSKAAGLIGKKNLPEKTGLLIMKCKGIHTFFMRFPIDVVFINSNNKVVKIIENLKPWRMPMPVLSSKFVLEFPSGLLKLYLIQINDKIIFK